MSVVGIRCETRRAESSIQYTYIEYCIILSSVYCIYAAPAANHGRRQTMKLANGHRTPNKSLSRTSRTPHTTRWAPLVISAGFVSLFPSSPASGGGAPLSLGMEIRWRYDGDLHVDYRVDVLPRKSAPMAPDVPDAEPYAEPVSSPRGAYRAFA